MLLNLLAKSNSIIFSQNENYSTSKVPGKIKKLPIAVMSWRRHSLLELEPSAILDPPFHFTSNQQKSR